MGLKKSITKALGNLAPSPITIDFNKGGSRTVQTVAPYPKEVLWDESVQVHKTENGVEFVRTPDSQFEKSARL